jgi:hypothetical protein
MMTTAIYFLAYSTFDQQDATDITQ